MRVAWSIPLLILAMLSGTCATGEIRIGEAAQPLRFTELLHASAHSKVDWPSLRGKVVVLEFWATWCASCIEEIPHLNSMVRSAGSPQVQFIAVDDETPKVVEKFVARIPISGWLGIDTTGKTIHVYGAETRPRTVVVDTRGRIAAILNPAQLTGAALNLAAGNQVRFPSNIDESLHSQALSDAAKLDELAAAGRRALFDISVRPGRPGEHASIVSSSPGEALKLDAINMPLQTLTSFMGLPLDRIRMDNPAPGVWSLHVAAPSGTLEQLGPAIQLAVASATNLHLVRTDHEEDAWILEKTPRSTTLLQSASAGNQHLCFYERRTQKVILQRCSLDQLAETLENYLQTPVLNETGITGEFNAIFDLAKPDAEALIAALEQNVGLTLVRARRNVERIEFQP